MTVQVRSFVSLVVVMSVGVLFATDAQIKSWANNVSLDWKTATIWENNYVPNSTTDVVNLYVAGNSYRLALRLNGDISVGAVTNGPLLGCYGFISSGVRLSIRQAEGFNKSQWPFGYVWGGGSVYGPSSSVRSGVNFLGTPEEPTCFRLCTLGSFPFFGVPNVGGAGRIDHLVDTGAFVKDGPGDLCLGAPCELTTALLLQEGSVSFAAKEETRTDQPADEPFVHVDASCVGTLLGYDDPDSGRSYVTNWYDVRKNGWVARAETWQHPTHDFKCSAPYLADHTVNGRPLVDFGDCRASSSGQSADHPAASMLWSSRSEKIREVFLAIEVRSNGGNCQPIGESSEQTLGMNGVNGNIFTGSVPARGDVRVNGASAASINGYPRDQSKLSIISCALPMDKNAKAGWFGRYGSTSATPTVGGFCLGEALVYTRDLTEAERRQTIAYLKKRWLSEATHKTERAEWDLGDIVGGTNENAICVADGDVARVRRLRGTATNGFVKKGAGTLAVDRIEPAAAPVTVESGALRLTDTSGSAPTLTASTLPADPVFHFDATDEDSVELVEGSETEVERWCDVRGEGYPVAVNEVDAKPVVGKSVSPTGLRTVEFVADIAGPPASAAARMKFEGAETYEGFMIWKSTVRQDSSALDKNPPHFCPVSQFRSKSQLLPTGGNAGVGFAVWSVDGRVLNQFDDSFADGKAGGEWVLIHFTSSRPITVNGMARLGANYGGGCAIGEMIGYGRMLTDRERRGVEAYLMKRWLGKEHPDNIPWAGALTFGSGTEAVIDTACDIAPTTLATSSTTLTKKGLGTATVGAIPSSVESLSFDFDAEGKVGGLAVPGEYAAPATMSVTLTLPSEEVAQSLVGTAVRLIGAESVTDGANVAGWTLNALNCGRVVCRLAVRADGVYATFSKPGLMLILR